MLRIGGYAKCYGLQVRGSGLQLKFALGLRIYGIRFSRDEVRVRVRVSFSFRFRV